MEVPTIDIKSVNIKERLGQGGFGIVYKAEWNNRQVAVKETYIDSVYNSHDREVEQLSRLDHPNIIKIIGTSSDNRFCYLILEYAECGTLDALLHGGATYRLPHALSWTRQCAEAVAYLHNLTPKPLLHRDLKPANILLANKSRQVKLCDFGTVVELKNTMTKETGTVSYMAPDVMQSGKYSVKCDVYSLGIVLWEILSRVKPFNDFTNKEAKMNAIMKGQRPELNHSWDNPIKSLITSCWNMNANERPTMQNVVEKLNPLMASYPGADNPIEYEFRSASKRTSEDTTSVRLKDITTEKKLGKGYYSIVYWASWKTNKVAVKYPLTPIKDVNSFASQMKDLLLLKHENVIEIYGDCKSSTIIMEYAEDGTLHMLLHNSIPQTRYTTAHAMSWAFQCAKGLDYLHGLMPRPVILGNLESRNLLLFDKARRLKIGSLDNILDRKRNMIPYKQRAIECLGEFLDPICSFTAKYDTLCWGILLWEVLQRNHLYPAYFSTNWRNAEILKLNVQNCESDIKKLLTSCWGMQPAERPDMSNVVETMKQLMVSFPGSDEPLDYNWPVQKKYES